MLYAVTTHVVSNWHYAYNIKGKSKKALSEEYSFWTVNHIFIPMDENRSSLP